MQIGKPFNVMRATLTFTASVRNYGDNSPQKPIHFSQQKFDYRGKPFYHFVEDYNRHLLELSARNQVISQIPSSSNLNVNSFDIPNTLDQPDSESTSPSAKHKQGGLQELNCYKIGDYNM